MALGPQLRGIRLAQGFTQAELAPQVGIQQAHVSLVETGSRTTTLEVLERWAEACGAEIVIRRRATSDQAEQLLEAAAALAPEDAALLLRVARALPKVRGRSKAVLTASFEAAAEDSGG